MSTTSNRAIPPRGISPAASTGRKQQRPVSNRRAAASWTTRLVCLAGLAACVSESMAQDVLSSPPLIPAVPAAVQDQLNSNPMQVFAPTETIEPTLLQWGPVHLHPHVDYQFTYGNGIQSSPGDQHNTVVQSLSPGVLLDLGDHWTLDYTPTLSFYSGGDFQNTVDHQVQLSWGTAYEDWFFTGSQGVAITSDPEVETAAQTDQQNYTTALNASYQFNDSLSLDLGVNQNLNYIGNSDSTNNYEQNLVDSRNWSTMNWLNYQFWPRLSVGLGLGGGYTQQDGSPDTVNEQYQGRINWRATDKIRFQVSGGINDQQYLNGGASGLLTPIYGVAIQYQPFEQTRLSLSANQTVSASSFQNQTTENTSIIGDFNQRLLGKLMLDLSGGYTKTKYLATMFGLSTGRTDDIYSFNARLSCPFLKRATASVFYSYTENISNQSGFALGANAFGYNSNQIGLELGYRY